VLRRLEFHYTPKHASWLNMVEIEIDVLKGQYLDRRIDSCHRLMAEIDARQAQRNQIGARITRMFSIDSILSSKIRLLGQAPLTLGLHVASS
jgi:DDE superfamily endonuclease